MADEPTDRDDLVEAQGVDAGPPVDSGAPVGDVTDTGGVGARPPLSGGPVGAGNGGLLSEHPDERPPEPGQQLAAGEG